MELSKETIKRIVKNKKLLKVIVSAAVTVAINTYFQDFAFAAGENFKYSQPIQLNPIFQFIDWLVFIVRLIGSTLVGLISTIAGYKWGTDISGSGQTEAKKLLKNCAWGLFWLWAGTTVTSIFVHKLEQLLS